MLDGKDIAKWHWRTKQEKIMYGVMGSKSGELFHLDIISGEDGIIGDTFPPGLYDGVLGSESEDEVRGMRNDDHSRDSRVRMRRKRKLKVE